MVDVKINVGIGCLLLGFVSGLNIDAHATNMIDHRVMDILTGSVTTNHLRTK